MATLAQFRAQFPEFNSVPDPLIGTMLQAAYLELDTSVWGAYSTTTAPTKTDQGQMYLAAHKLASSPFGQNARMVSDKGGARGYMRTQYGQEFKLLQMGVVSGFRVA
jgi:hypothetical protein